MAGVASPLRAGMESPRLPLLSFILCLHSRSFNLWELSFLEILQKIYNNNYLVIASVRFSLSLAFILVGKSLWQLILVLVYVTARWILSESERKSLLFVWSELSADSPLKRKHEDLDAQGELCRSAFGSPRLVPFRGDGEGSQPDRRWVVLLRETNAQCKVVFILLHFISSWAAERSHFLQAPSLFCSRGRQKGNSLVFLDQSLCRWNNKGKWVCCRMNRWVQHPRGCSFTSAL